MNNVIIRRSVKIMCDDTQNVLAAQSEVGQRLRDDSYPSIKVLASRAGWHENRFSGYFPACPQKTPTQLPLGALHKLVRKDVLPAKLLSLLSPDGWQTIKTPDYIDPYTVSELVREFEALKAQFHHPDSEAGEALGPKETAALVKKAAELRAVA